MVTAARADRFRWIVASIAGYCRQTHARRELVIVLDEPALGDRQRLEEHVGRLGRSDIRLYPAPRKSPLGALRNLAIDSAAGEVICVWDDDDLHHPLRIERQVGHLLETGGAAVCLADCLHLFMNSGRCYWVNWARTRCRGLPGTLLAHRDPGLRYPESGPFAQKGEDTDLLLRLIEGGSAHFLAAPPFLYVYRFHGTNTFHHERHATLARQFSEEGAHLQNHRAPISACLQALDVGLEETRVVDRQGMAFRVPRLPPPPREPPAPS
jgi:glycosyltransferase involved in cell wall biosynthesis